MNTSLGPFSALEGTHEGGSSEAGASLACGKLC